MMVMTEAPIELYDADLVVPAVATADGELLGKVNDLPAGPWLAVLVDGIDPATLTGWDLPAYLSACQRVQSWAAARLTAGVDELASRSGPHGADKEVALALSEPVGAAQRRMWQARRLRRSLPGVWRAMAVGDLTERHASQLVEATARIDDPELAAAVEQRVLAHAGGKTATELARYARRVLARLDPAGTQRRARAARDDADVHYQPGVDGMADVTVRAPVEDAAIVTTACDAYAAAAKAAGDPRRIGVLRAEAPVRWASTYLTGLADGHVPRAAGRPIEVQITVPLRAALGLDDLPAEVPGAGIIPRDVIAKLIADELPRLRMLVIDETTGQLGHHAETSYRPTAAQIAHIRATYVHSVGPGSQVPAVRTDTDHVTPHPVGPTQIGNLIPLDRSWHRAKTKRQLTVTIDHNGTVTVTTATGQTRTVTPYDYRMHDPDAAGGSDSLRIVQERADAQ